MRRRPDFGFETRAASAGRTRVVGIDEVGRGPLAGPVIAAAVRLEAGRVPGGLHDSKALSEARREALAPAIRAASDWALGGASNREIDALGLEAATQLAMARAARRLEPDWALVDGLRLPAGLPCGGEAVVRGDGRVASIAAASVLAKVARDRIMVALSQRFPGYGWERNKGYPTAEHRDALRTHGVTQHHRRSFRTVHQILCH